MRVWDVFFNEGSKILFRVGLALLKSNEPTIMQTTDSGTMFNLLRNIPQTAFDADNLLNVSVAAPISSPRQLLTRAPAAGRVLPHRVVSDGAHHPPAGQVSAAHPGGDCADGEGAGRPQETMTCAAGRQCDRHSKLVHAVRGGGLCFGAEMLNARLGEG